MFIGKVMTIFPSAENTTPFSGKSFKLGSVSDQKAQPDIFLLNIVLDRSCKKTLGNISVRSTLGESYLRKAISEKDIRNRMTLTRELSALVR